MLKGRVYLCDVDGNTSAAILYSFLKNKFNVNPVCFFHIGKQHGLRPSKEQNLIKDIIDSGINLLFLPDAGSGDWRYCKELKRNGIDTIVLDHHEFDENNEYAIVVNNQAQENTNHYLSGCGVTEKFISAYCRTYNVKMPYFMDMVATSLVSDSMNLSSLENRAYIYYGLQHIKNPMLRIMADKLNRRGNIPEGFSFGLIPPINSVQRDNNQKNKSVVFDALCQGYQDHQGDDDAKFFEDAMKIAQKAHRLQKKITAQMAKDIEPNLDMSHKVIIGFTDSDNKEYVGLVANNFMSKYGKPVILLREANPTQWSGSVRSNYPIKDIINESGLAECQGHAKAHGILLKKSKLDKLIKMLDRLPIDVEPVIEVACELQPSNISVGLCNVIANNSLMWGEGVSKPLFYVKGRVTTPFVYVYEKKTTTVKLQINGVDFVLFRAKKEDVEKLKEMPEFNIEMLVYLQNNEWNGIVSPQAVIERYEISPVEYKDKDWEDLF